MLSNDPFEPAWQIYFPFSGTEYLCTPRLHTSANFPSILFAQTSLCRFGLGCSLKQLFSAVQVSFDLGTDPKFFLRSCPLRGKLISRNPDYTTLKTCPLFVLYCPCLESLKLRFSLS